MGLVSEKSKMFLHMIEFSSDWARHVCLCQGETEHGVVYVRYHPSWTDRFSELDYSTTKEGAKMARCAFGKPSTPPFRRRRHCCVAAAEQWNFRKISPGGLGCLMQPTVFCWRETSSSHLSGDEGDTRP
ncbi:unnamed protein product [Ectocarpus sp. 13 AM-2016]